MGGERGRKRDLFALLEVFSFLTKIRAASVQLLQASPASPGRLLHLTQQRFRFGVIYWKGF